MPSNEQRRENAKRKLERQLERRVERNKRRKIIGSIAAVVAVLVVAGGIYFLATRPASAPPAAAPSNSAPANPPVNIPTALAPAPKRPTALPATATCAYPASAQEKAAKAVQAPPTTNISAQGTAPVSLGTSIGELKFTLDRAVAPCTVNNFLSLAKQGYFDGTECHRMTTSDQLQVLQCGDPTGTGMGGPGYTFKDEVYPELAYGRGILAMANSGPDTNGSQFFVVYGNAQLPPKYTAFGTVDAGSLKLIDKVAQAGVTPGQQGDPQDGKPTTPVKITKVTS